MRFAQNALNWKFYAIFTPEIRESSNESPMEYVVIGTTRSSVSGGSSVNITSLRHLAELLMPRWLRLLYWQSDSHPISQNLEWHQLTFRIQKIVQGFIYGTNSHT